MAKKPKNRPRIPPPAGGVEVNFCKNPRCANFGVAADPAVLQGRRPGGKSHDNYHLKSRAKNTPIMFCMSCEEFMPLKSNLGVSEEITRLTTYLAERPKKSCASAGCKHKGIGAPSPEHYWLFGKTHSGSTRYRCRACKKTFAVGGSQTGHKRPEDNVFLFKLLMNKMPFRRICEVLEISHGTLYGKIDFLHRQCISFVGEQERRLLDGHGAERLYVSVDRQDHMLNWTDRADKRNIMMSAVGSADTKSGYVFGMHLNFDGSIDPEEFYADVDLDAEYALPEAYRRHARLWLPQDYLSSARKFVKNKHAKLRRAAELEAEIAGTYEDAAERDDIESPEEPSETAWLPKHGMQVHAEYTLYAHFFLLERLFRGVKKVRFFLDQESGIRAACLAAFKDRVTARTCDAFYVRIDKRLTVDEKKRLKADSARELKRLQAAHPGLSRTEVRRLVLKERITAMKPIGKWRDRWLNFPFPDMSEPKKAVCYLTDFGDYDEDHLANLYGKASLHAIDRFFMQGRRRVNLIERPIHSASSAARAYHGYSAYNPQNLAKLMEIYRVFYNYIGPWKIEETPAMRLGLADRKMTYEDIVSFA